MKQKKEKAPCCSKRGQSHERRRSSAHARELIATTTTNYNYNLTVIVMKIKYKTALFKTNCYTKPHLKKAHLFFKPPLCSINK